MTNFHYTVHEDTTNDAQHLLVRILVRNKQITNPILTITDADEFAYINRGLDFLEATVFDLNHRQYHIMVHNVGDSDFIIDVFNEMEMYRKRLPINTNISLDELTSPFNKEEIRCFSIVPVV